MRRFGHLGRVLRVDLSTGRIEVEALDDESWRLYAGGSLLGSRLLLTETRPGLDAFDPDALLIFTSSVVAGHRAAALPRFSIVAKSPLTGGIGEALIATMCGLAIAILALIPFNYFSRRLAQLQFELESAATNVEVMVASAKQKGFDTVEFRREDTTPVT